MQYDLIVTRHNALVEYLIEEGIVDPNIPVISHVTDDKILKDKNVIGVLPLTYAAKCNTMTDIHVAVPPKLRGTELTITQVRRYIKKPVTFQVRIIK